MFSTRDTEEVWPRRLILTLASTIPLAIKGLVQILASCRLLTADCKLFSHSRAVEAAMFFLKAAGSFGKSSYSREPFLQSSRHFLLQ